MYKCFMVVIDAHTIMLTLLWERTIICPTDLQNLQHTLGKGKLKNSAKVLCNIGLVNLPLKLDTKIFLIFCPLETDMNKLFKYTKKVKTIPDAPDGQMLWYNTPNIQYEQIISSTISLECTMKQLCF